MNSFDVLTIASAVGAALSLFRLRPTAFILAANHLLALRALSSISDYGRPSSEAYVPDYVFGEPTLQTAFWILTISTGLLLTSLLIQPKPHPVSPSAFPPLPRWTLPLFALYFALVMASLRSIVSSNYADSDQMVFGYGYILSGGAHILVVSFFLYEIHRRVRVGALSPLRGFMLLLVIFTLTDYLKGMTGLVTGILATAAVLTLGQERQRWRRNSSLIIAFSLLLVGASVVRGVRRSLSSDGTQAVVDYVGSVVESEAERSRNGEGFERTANATQTAAHMLECITLYDRGVSRQWRSIYNTIEYTFKPSFLLSALGLVRSKEAAWELGDYFIHLGGINVLGELYWNGGYACVIIMWTLILAWAYLCDTRYTKGPIYLLFVCNFAPGILQGFGYGFAQVARGFFNGLLAALLYLLWQRFPSARASLGTTTPTRKRAAAS